MKKENELKPVVWSLAAAAAALGGLALAGWASGLQILASFSAQWFPMRVPTALCLICCAAALIAAQRGAEDRAGRLQCRVFGAAVGSVALLSLLAWFHLLQSGHEGRWLDLPFLSVFFGPASRMAPLTACMLLGLGVAFIFLSLPSRGAGVAVAHALTVPVAVASFMVVVSYVFGAEALRTQMAVSVALNTNLACCAICAGIFLVRPDSWFVRVFLRRESAGIIARWLLPAVVLIPVLVTWLSFEAERAGLLQPPVSAALSAIANGIALLCVIWVAARAAGLSDARRRRAEEALRDSEERYRSLVEMSPDAVIVCRDSRIVQVNRAALGIMRADSGALIGRDPRELLPVRCEAIGAERIETQVARLDGAVADVELTASPFTDRHGDGTQLILRDIGKRKRAEDALRQQREWLRVTLGSIGDAVLATDAAGTVTFLNAVCAALTGWTEEQALGRPAREVFRIINERTRMPAEDIVARVLREGHVVALENHTALLSRDGREIPIEDSAAPIRDAAGNLAGVVLVFHDVTEKRRVQDALRESEQRVRRKLDSILSPQGDIGELDLSDIVDGPAIQSLMEDFYKVVAIPMAIVDLHGKVVVGVGWQDVCVRYHRAHPECCKHCVESDTQLTAGVAPGEFRLYKCKNNMWDVATPLVVGGKHVGNLFSGQFFFADEEPDREVFRSQARLYGFDEEAYFAALGRVPRLRREAVSAAMAFLMKLGHMLSVLSYSNIKLARSLSTRDALTAVLARTQAIAHLGSWELDLRADRLSWSDEVYRIFGLEPQEFEATYEAFLERVHPDDRGAVDAAYSGSLRDGKSSYEIMHRILRKDTGEVRWVHEKCEHIAGEDGALVRSIGMVQDVTERKRFEEQLERSEALYRGIARNLPDGAVYLADRDLRVLVAEGSLLGRIGQERRGMEGLAVAEAFAGTGCGVVVEERFRKALRGDSASYEDQCHNRHVWTHYVPLRDDNRAVVGAMSLWLDISERKRFEEQLRHAQKLESIGLLAGGIAHDFNNLLVGVIGNASLAEDMLPPGSPASDALRRVVKAGEQAAHLTRQMLAYAGKGRFLLEPVDLCALIRESAALLQSSISKKIAVRIETDGSARVESDPSQMQQVFMNLALNAAEAVGDAAGTISIRAGETGLDAGFISNELAGWAVEPGRFVLLEVRDTGCGMDEATRTRIFDPFYTTKFQGRGLGLAAVAGIVRAHNGAIAVASTPGAGSTFRVFLPALASPFVRPGEDCCDTDAGPGGNATILIVDDEEIVRDLAKNCLERHGYDVLAVGSGLAAIEIVESAPAGIDLVVLDLSMPGMSGEEALPHLREIDPELRVIVSSGYSENEALRVFDGARVSGFLQKPYTVQELARKVKSVLAGLTEPRVTVTSQPPAE